MFSRVFTFPNFIVALIFCVRAASRSDMMTPLNRSVARIAKPGERLFLVSDNSSPIVDGTYTATKGRAKKAIKPAKVHGLIIIGFF